MKKKFRVIIFFICFLFVRFDLLAQVSNDGSYILAILPATSSARDGYNYAASVEDLLATAFNGKSRFTLVDRTKITQLESEKTLQKNEDFINGYTVQQSKSLGAQYIISTDISQVNFTKYSKEKAANALMRLTTKTETLTSGINANVVINCKVIDVETGTVKTSKIFNLSEDFDGETIGSVCINKLISSSGNKFNIWVNEAFPIYMKVIKVESLDKKGLPKEILIKGGKEMNLQSSKAFFVLNNSSKIDIFYIEKLAIDGKEYTRNIVVGNATIAEEQGDFSVCKVHSGAKAIQDCLSQGKTLLIKVNRY